MILWRNMKDKAFRWSKSRTEHLPPIKAETAQHALRANIQKYMGKHFLNTDIDPLLCTWKNFVWTSINPWRRWLSIYTLLELVTCHGYAVNAEICAGTNVLRTCAPVARSLPCVTEFGECCGVGCYNTSEEDRKDIETYLKLYLVD